MRVSFTPNNNIKYFQDFQFKTNIPHNIEFIATKLSDTEWKLIENGYGSIEEYGNGAIFLKTDVLDIISMFGRVRD